MKTQKKRWLVPMMVCAMAIGGAFMTNAATKSSHVSTTGYLSLQMPCDTAVECALDGIPGCTVPGGTAYGKINPSDGFCPLPLFRP